MSFWSVAVAGWAAALLAMAENSLPLFPIFLLLLTFIYQKNISPTVNLYNAILARDPYI